MKILTAACHLYLERALVLVASVLKNTNHEIILRLIGRDFSLPAAVWNEPRIRIDMDYPQGGFKDEYHRADYAANIRVQMMAEEIQDGSPVLWLDADSIVRAPLGRIEDLLQEFTTVAYRRYEPEFQDEENTFLISTVGLAATPDAICFSRVWQGYLAQIREQDPRYRCSIMTCQLAYYRTLQLLGADKFFSVPLSFTDMTFRPGSEIWEAQGPRKFQDPRWLAEVEKYRNYFEALK